MGPRRAAILASLLGVLAFSLLVAGCGGGASPGVATAGSSRPPGAAGSVATTSEAHALLVAGRCLRHHGLTGLPDPAIASSGPAKGQPILDKQFLSALPNATVSSALEACRAALSKAGIGGGGPNARPSPEELRDGLAFARCVRRHGISHFPDPNGQGHFDLAGTGIDPHALTPAQLAAARACLSAAHGSLHIPTQGTSSASAG